MIYFLILFPDDLKRNVSQKTQEVLLNVLAVVVVDADNAGPILTALVSTDANAAQNR